jgi:ubiquinone biosynthesis protein COQ9
VIKNENITPDNLFAYPNTSEAFKEIDEMITNKIKKLMHLEKFRNLIFCIFEISSIIIPE